MDRENEKRAEVVRVRAAFCILVLVANRSVELEERNRFESTMIERGKVSSRFEFSSFKHELLFDR